jgi:hypothetical protein
MDESMTQGGAVAAVPPQQEEGLFPERFIKVYDASTASSTSSYT